MAAAQAEEVRKEHLKQKGSLTLHDESSLLSSQLHHLTVRIKGMELREGEREQHDAGSA